MGDVVHALANLLQKKAMRRAIAAMMIMAATMA